MNHDEIATKLYDAATNAQALPSFSGQGEKLSVADAYLIQNLLLERSLGEGDPLCGFKMGLTSKAKQRDVQVFEPIRGFLKRSSEIQKGGEVAMSKRIHPRVEPEVAVVLKSPLRGPGVTLRDVHAALAGVYPALEIVDSRYEAFSFQLADVIADNTSAAHFMVGSWNLVEMTEDVRLMGVLVRKNGKLIESGAPAAVLGDPFLSVMALANSLGAEGLTLEPGMVILTGGITNSVPFQKGDVLEIEWPKETLTFTAV